MQVHTYVRTDASPPTQTQAYVEEQSHTYIYVPLTHALTDTTADSRADIHTDSHTDTDTYTYIDTDAYTDTA